MTKKPPLPEGHVVIAERQGAKLVKRPDGTTYCLCPFLCYACSEVCEFA